MKRVWSDVVCDSRSMLLMTKLCAGAEGCWLLGSASSMMWSMGTTTQAPELTVADSGAACTVGSPVYRSSFSGEIQHRPELTCPPSELDNTIPLA